MILYFNLQAINVWFTDTAENENPILPHEYQQVSWNPPA